MSLAWSVNRLDSFSVRAIGYLACNPEVLVSEEGTYCRICLTGADSTEDDAHGRFAVVVQSIEFVATHMIGSAIAASARKGDQLFIQGKIREHHWTAKGTDEDYTFVITSFRFGARSGGQGAGTPATPARAPTLPVQSTEAEVAV